MRSFYISGIVLLFVLFSCSKKEEAESTQPIQQIDSIVARVTPNPTVGNITITFDKEYSEVTIEISDLHGKVMQSETFRNKQEISWYINGPSGLYFMKITHISGSSAIRRIVRS